MTAGRDEVKMYRHLSNTYPGASGISSCSIHKRTLLSLEGGKIETYL